MVAVPLVSTCLRTAADAYHLLHGGFTDCSTEQLQVVHLDHRGWLLALDRIDGLRPDRIALPIGDVLRRALSLQAAAMLLAHTHPSGDPAPSPADRRATRALAQAARALDIRLLDHLVFAGSACVSFCQNGWL